MKSLHVKKGDRVKVIAGKDKGKIGEIIAVSAESNRVTVEAKGIEYEILDLSEDPTALEQVKALGYMQAPVVVTDEGHWSGFRPDKIDELASRLA